MAEVEELKPIVEIAEPVKIAVSDLSDCLVASKLVDLDYVRQLTKEQASQLLGVDLAACTRFNSAKHKLVRGMQRYFRERDFERVKKILLESTEFTKSFPAAEFELAAVDDKPCLQIWFEGRGQ